jgi:hypothetical protein
MLLAISPYDAPILHDDLPLRLQAEIIFSLRKRREGEPRLRLINPASVSGRLLLCGGSARVNHVASARISIRSCLPMNAFTTCRESRGESIGKDHLLKPVLRPGGLNLPTLADFEAVIQM